MDKDEKRIRKLLEDASTPDTTSERDPYSDLDGEYGSDTNYEPDINELSSSDDDSTHCSSESVSDSDDLQCKSSRLVPSINASQAVVPPDVSVKPGNSCIQTPDRILSADHANEVSRPVNPELPSDAHEPNEYSDNASVAEIPVIQEDAQELPDKSVGVAAVAEIPVIPGIVLSDELHDPVPVDAPAGVSLGAENPVIPADAQILPSQNQRPLESSTESMDNGWHSNTAPIPEFDFDFLSEGLRIAVPDNPTELDIFTSVFSDQLLDFIVSRTNSYGINLTQSNQPHTRNSRKKYFRPVTKEEMLSFLGLCLLQGQIRAPNRTSMFSYSNPLYFHPFYTYIMSSRRYEQILRCICTASIDAKGEKKITDFIEAICGNFRDVYGPGRQLSIDESLILFRGRLHFRQYIKSKKARYGIKFYELTTADGYVLNVIMYSGKNDSDEESTKKTEQIVMKLLRPYLMKGHHVFMDNFYNDVELSQKLLELRTHTSGTLRKSRKSNPKVLMATKLKKGDHFWRRKNQVYVSVWKDKRPVYCITTRNHPKLTYVSNRYGRYTKKPVEVAEYNKFMGGIDRKDQMVAYYSSPQKSIRWYKKVFFHLLDISTWNAFYLFSKYFKPNTRYEFLNYRDKLIMQMTKVDCNLKGKDVVRTGSIYSSRHTNDSASTVRPGPSQQPATTVYNGHWPENIPVVTENSKRNIKYLNCSLCSKKKKRKETRFRCKICKNPLCPACFEEWHINFVGNETE